jgi:hypothetical protein
MNHSADDPGRHGVIQRSISREGPTRSPDRARRDDEGGGDRDPATGTSSISARAGRTIGRAVSARKQNERRGAVVGQAVAKRKSASYGRRGPGSGEQNKGLPALASLLSRWVDEAATRFARRWPIGRWRASHWVGVGTIVWVVLAGGRAGAVEIVGRVALLSRHD